MLLHGVDLLAFFTIWGLTLASWIVGGGVIVRLWSTRRRTRGLLKALVFVSASSAFVAAVLIDDVLRYPSLLGFVGLAPVALCCAAWATWCRATAVSASSKAVDPHQSSR